MKAILDTTVAALKDAKWRRFIWVEIYYFHKWWVDPRTTDSQRADVRALIKAKQWEFVMGGWVMPDEATTTWSAVSDQLTEGHLFLNRTFGITPSIGWQIDPFGASVSIAELYKTAGFKHHVIDRINFKTRATLEQNKALEFLWYPSARDTTPPGAPTIAPNFGPNFGGKFRDSESNSRSGAKKSSSKDYREYITRIDDSSETLLKAAAAETSNDYIFTHILDDNYCFPLQSGFDFEGDPVKNPPITNDNIQARADEYARQIRSRTPLYRTNKLLMLHQCDFRYQQANLQFDNMDKIIEFINVQRQRYNVSIKWALLSDYFASLDATYPASFWPIRGEEDFMPYADDQNSWWTGYYSSRPQLKGLVRKSESELKIASNLASYLQALVPSLQVPPSPDGKPTTSEQVVSQLHRAVAVAQHHDAVSGTERELVAENYAQLLWDARALTTPLIEYFLNYIASRPGMFQMNAGNQGKSFGASKKSNFWDHVETYEDQRSLSSDHKDRTIRKGMLGSDQTRKRASLANPDFSNSTAGLQSMSVGNPLTVLVYNSLHKTRFEVIKVPVWFDDIVVQNANGKTLSVSILSNLSPMDESGAPYTMFIEATQIPPAGFITLSLVRTGAKEPNSPITPFAGNPGDQGDITISNGELEVTVASNGKISQITADGMPIPFEADILAYESFAVPGEQDSGAYIFRQAGKYANTVSEMASVTIRSAGNVHEIHQQFTPFVSVATRLYNNPRNYMDVSYRIGPLPGNKELVSRYSTALFTPKGSIATDSNAWATMPRTYQAAKLEVPSNYYPSVYSSYLQPEVGGVHFAVVTDRSHGVSSVGTGTLEIMLHRRLLQDDKRGLEQALNDTTTVFLNHRLLFAKDLSYGTTQRYHYALETNFPLSLYYSTAPNYMQTYTTSFNASKSLPHGIQCFMRLVDPDATSSNPGRVLVRYAYQYSYRDAAAPLPLVLSLAFGSAKMCSVQETTLTGTKPIGAPLSFTSSITMNPKQIRTFLYSPC